VAYSVAAVAGYRFCVAWILLRRSRYSLSNWKSADSIPNPEPPLLSPTLTNPYTDENAPEILEWGNAPQRAPLESASRASHIDRVL
jgi:hypothetical protein